MTSPDQPPTTAHDPTAKPLLEELPEALAEIERMLAPLHLADRSIDDKSPIARARAELNRIVMQIRQSAPAELEPMWLRVPTADAKTILYTVDRSLAGDPTGGVLLRWPAYDALRHLLWRSDKLFAAVIGLLQDRGRHDVALRLRNGSPDTTALHGLSFAADKEFIATARMRMSAARVAEAGEVAKIDNPGAAADAVLTSGTTTQGNGGHVSFNPSTDTGALADAAWRAEGEEIRDRVAAQQGDVDVDDLRGPWSNITPYLVAQELRRVPCGATLLEEPWISALAYHNANNRRRWLEIRNVLRQYKVLADVTAAIRHHAARPIDPRDQVSAERQVAKLTAWFGELRHRLHTSVDVDDDTRAVLYNVIDAAIGPADPKAEPRATVGLRASMAALRVVAERLAVFAPQELAVEIQTLEKLERDVVHLFGTFGNLGDIQTGGTATLSDAIRSQEARDPEGAAALREAGGDALKAVELLRTRAASPVSQSDALRRAMTEIDRGLDGYKLSPEVELARIQVDVLLLLVETLRGGAEYQIGGMIAGALEQVADDREREHADKWKGVPAERVAQKPSSIADLRAVAAAVKQRLGGGA